jgi:hypothetical protein
MRYLGAWRLLLDSLLSNSKAKDDIPFIRVFLERAVACMTSDTYLGVVLPPELTPNLAFHFYILHGLPTNVINPFTDFMRSELVSTIAQTHAQIPIQVHPDQLAPADDVKLITASAQSALKHREKTPRHSNVPVDLLLPPSGTSGATRPVAESPLCASNPFQGTPTNVPASSTLARSGSRRHPVEPPVTPSGTNLFGGSSKVYSPPFHHSSSRQPAPPPAAPAHQVLFPTPPIVKPKWEEIASWTLFSLAHCAPEYLLLCFLLMHGHELLDLFHAEYRENRSFHRPSDKRLFARNPSIHCSTRTLLPIFHNGASGIVDSVRLYIQSIVDHHGLGTFSTFYTQSFFQASVLKNLLQPATWRMEASYDPTNSNASSFHVYNFLSALRAHAASPALLPISGLTSLAMKPLATFIFTWFRSLDVTQGFSDAHFDQSLLGCRLRYLLGVLDRHQVQTLWASNARTMTYVWLQNLQSLLYLFQPLSIEAMWKPDSGFLPPAPDCPEVCPINQDGQHFVDILQEWDTQIREQWRPTRLHAAAAFYDAAIIPRSHFITAPTPRIPRNPNPNPANNTGNTPPLAGTRRPTPEPDFRAIKPLFALVNPPLEAKGILDQFQGASPTGSRKPVLHHPNGKSSLICFTSSAAAPFNVCNAVNCLRNQRSRARPRSGNSGPFNAFSHVDFNDPYWASQPEAFWTPVVTWLRLPGVSAVILPSEFLKTKTPNTPW